LLIPILLAALAIASGLAVNRGLRLPASLAPFSGLAALVVLTRWCVALGAPPWLTSALVVLLAVLGIATAWPSANAALAALRACRVPTVLVLASSLIPAVMLASLFAGVDTPVSNHDGAYHVETVDYLRRGVGVPGWYPVGFHALAAAVLGLLPWLDTARGAVEIAQGIVLLAPVAVFCLGLALGMTPLQASIGAVVQALTFVFPYDNLLWGGWPLGTSLLLLMGLWAVGARWIRTPTWSLATLAGLLAGAIVLTHGTEVYSAVVGLGVIAALSWRHIRVAQLARHLPLAAALAVMCAYPYASALLGWLGGGGASSVGAAALDSGAPQAERGAGGDWLEFVLGIAGAAGFIDLPLRAVMLVLGARMRQTRAVLAAWATFAALLFAVSFIDLPAVNWVFMVTFPWLVHHRPPQLVIVFGSLLVGAGLAASIDWLRSLQVRLAAHPHAWRRIAIGCAILLGFFAEGSAVTVYKTIDGVIAQHYVYTADDRAAMAWLRQHAQPGDMVLNDLAIDAGIWAPYKAAVSIVFPRSASGTVVEEREPILANVLDLGSSPKAKAQACVLQVRYVYYGARTFPEQERHLPDRRALQESPILDPVFASGDAAIFRIHDPCP
jgi:hypothetical protein